MASFTKSKLKAAKDAISKKDYAKARDASNDVLSFEPENYHANVFLGLASLELGNDKQSEQAYRTAIKANPQQPLAWQGLSKLFERTNQWDEYRETLISLVDIFAKLEDATKCAETLQKYIDAQRQHGTKDQIIETLPLLLPDSRFYSLLSTLPPPDHSSPTATTTLSIQTAVHNSLPVVEEIVRLTEEKEAEYIQKEVEKRRTRLNAAGPEVLKKQVGLEVWRSSTLPTFYTEIINHPNTSDDLRRETEAKVLRYKHNYQCALSSTGEDKQLRLKLGEEIKNIVDGAVLLDIPDDLAWSMKIESEDNESLDGLDLPLLRRYMRLFPSTHYTRLIRAYFTYSEIPLKEDDESDTEDNEPTTTAEAEQTDPIEEIISSVGLLPGSIFAHRILSEVYLYEEDYQNAIPVAEKGLSLVVRHEADTAVKLPNTQKSFSVTLGTSLVHLFPPKHHIRALRILDDVLTQDSNNVLALMGRAYIMQFAQKWSEARELFAKVVRLRTLGDVDVGLEAREEWAWCGFREAEGLGEEEEAVKLKEAIDALEGVRDRLELEEGVEKRKARVWWRLGQCHWQLGGPSGEEAYKHYITSLKRYPSFAASFTSLGIYYLEHASPPDTARASKCFQKAVELDPREAEAARKLAEGFAEEREWDLVEVIARRTIEGEGGLTGKSVEGGVAVGELEASAIARSKPTNAWAWKALGVVELNKRNYSTAIQALQVALRTNETDGICWLRLGEAYTLAGRHAAALKALHRALELRPDDWMVSFQIGEVQRQTGLLTDAVKTFKSVLEKSPRETGVLLALAQTHLTQGRSESFSGYLGRSVVSYLDAISTALDLIEWSPGFRRIAWKTVVDALFELTEFASYDDNDSVNTVLSRLNDRCAAVQNDERVKDIPFVRIHQGTVLSGTDVLKVTVAVCSYRLALFTTEDDGVASARFDFGLALHRFAMQTPDEALRSKKVKDAIELLRMALVVEPTNPAYWAAFGNFHFADNAKIAQHAYIKALEINNKDVRVWANLGFLYLHNDDAELANEAFYRAQTLDPDYTPAWVGQGMVATLNGHEEDATALFEHAVGLSADLPEADLEFSIRAFRKLSSTTGANPTSQSTEDFLPSFFALDRYCRRRTSDPSALHLFGLICERLGHHELGVQAISRAIKILEAIYEETEDAAIERRFAIANANLARLLVAIGDDAEAIEKFDLAYGLLSEDDDSAETTVLRAMCQFGSGIANFHLRDLQAAMVSFQSALNVASGNSLVHGQVTVMLSQTLWAIGTDQFREAAKDRLLNCINTDPENLAAVTTLAAMGLLTGDDDLIDAALSEIIGLPMEEQLRRAPGRDVESLLVNHYLAEGNIDKAQSILTHSLHSHPSSLVACGKLASLSITRDQANTAQALMSKLLDSPPPTTHREELHNSLRVLAVALARVGETSENTASNVVQKAIHLAPWDVRNWSCLAYVQNANA